MNDTHHLLAMLSDQPADRDRLNFDPYAKTLADIIGDPATRTPLTIGVFGGWGRGKTSLMRMVERRLREDAAPDFPVHTVWFNAWLYSREDALWRALIARVVREVRGFELTEAQHAALDTLEERLYQPLGPASEHLTLPAGLLPGLTETAQLTPTGLELLRRQAQRDGDSAGAERLAQVLADAKISRALMQRDHLVALDDFRRQFETLSRDCVLCHGRLAVFVDDLDRCLPEKAVEVLEAVKLFLDVEGFVFVLGIAREVIEQGIRVRYREYESVLDGAFYLEKVIQIPFNLPPITAEAVQDYIHEETEGRLPDPRCETVFSVGLEPNPRRIKRTLNVFLLLWRLAQNRKDLRERITAVRLAKIVIIQQVYPRLFALLITGAHYLGDLERRFREDERPRNLENPQSPIRNPQALYPTSQSPSAVPSAAISNPESEISAGPLQEFLGVSLLRDLLTCIAEGEPDANFVDLPAARVREYLYLTRSTVEEPAMARQGAALPFEPQLVTIPAGPFLMGTPERGVDGIFKLMQAEYKDTKREWPEREIPQHEVVLDSYAISRYPITNVEYAHFIEDGGYTVRDYWTEAGWAQKENEELTEPLFWKDVQWNDPAQPVVGVSWYEAAAYCRWLAAKSGKPYRLPTEAEWEKAARGMDGRRYPWGNTWDASCCNNKESGPGKTVPVGQYPRGDSPYGVGDLAGQAREWCNSRFASYPYRIDDGREETEGNDPRVLRGGSWNDGIGWCRCSCRIWNYPGNGAPNRGFRCVRTFSSNP